MTHNLEMILFHCVVSKKVKVTRRLQEEVEDEFILKFVAVFNSFGQIRNIFFYFGSMYSNEIFHNRKVELHRR